VSQETLTAINKEVRRICDEQYARARRLLETHRPQLDAVAEGLLRFETLTGDEVGAVLRGDFEPIRIGEESLIEDNVVVHGRVVVGRRCVIGHGAILHGCTVGDGAVIGANAVVFDQARVGAGAMVTAGSVVYPKTRIPPRTLFRNSAAGNHPVTEPVGTRMQRWRATPYRRVIAMYRASGADRARPALADQRPGRVDARR